MPDSSVIIYNNYVTVLNGLPGKHWNGVEYMWTPIITNTSVMLWTELF